MGILAMFEVSHTLVIGIVLREVLADACGDLTHVTTFYIYIVVGFG